jgi:hypothetical protein
MGGAVAGIDDPGFSKVITWDICRITDSGYS